MIENTRVQKEITGHLKALSEKLSDLSVSAGKRSESSSIFE